MHMVHALALGQQEMSIETCLAPHLFEESKNFLDGNLPRHTNHQETKQRGGGGECQLFVFLICHLALRRYIDPGTALYMWTEAIGWGYRPASAT